METQNSAIIGVYDDHHAAIEALQILKRHHFPMKHVALVGKGEAVKEIDGVHTWEEITTNGTKVGSIIGGVIGVLAGLSLISIPGLGMVYVGGALGALLGGAEGAAIGGVGGTLIGTILGARAGTEGIVHGKPDQEDLEKYKDHIEAGKYLIIVHGPEDEIKHGHDLLVNETKHDHVETHISY